MNALVIWAARTRWSAGIHYGASVLAAGDAYILHRVRRPAHTSRERAERAAATVVAAELGLGPLDLDMALGQLAVAAALDADEAA